MGRTTEGEVLYSAVSKKQYRQSVVLTSDGPRSNNNNINAICLAVCLGEVPPQLGWLNRREGRSLYSLYQRRDLRAFTPTTRTKSPRTGLRDGLHKPSFGKQSP
ncbi:hypothetical protein NC652_034172 [Populus alba x Populus x berolinensis]|nr:hypothetical protein NC652_034172 [Populus alba x Populus x berolinensis]